MLRTRITQTSHGLMQQTIQSCYALMLMMCLGLMQTGQILIVNQPLVWIALLLVFLSLAL